LGFLEPALAELADEAEALRGNVEGLRALSTSLETFNEAFSSWLYVMNMNALTVDWPEVCVSLVWGVFVTNLVATGPDGSILYPCTAEGRCVLPLFLLILRFHLPTKRRMSRGGCTRGAAGGSTPGAD